MKISEIFNSVQGEGHWTGTPMTFVRLGECNLNCKFCDTPQRDQWTDVPRDDVLDQVMKLNRPRVCITGGEPLLQAMDVLWLSKSLRFLGKQVHLETNGTISVVMDDVWTTCSPKPGGDVNLWRGQVKEWKILVGPDGPLTPIPKAAELVYLQPLVDEECLAYNPYTGCILPQLRQIYKLLEENPSRRLGLQTHKILSIR